MSRPRLGRSGNEDPNGADTTSGYFTTFGSTRSDFDSSRCLPSWHILINPPIKRAWNASRHGSVEERRQERCSEQDEPILRLREDLGPQKIVKVLYSADNWATTNHMFATFESTAGPGEERWWFNAEVSDSEEQKIVVQYEVNGMTLVDDNMGSGYTMSGNQVVHLIPGSM